MTEKRIVKTVLSKEQAEGVGARVRRSIGTYELRNLDPFLMLDEFFVKAPAGFQDHPHRGFETVTYMLDGVFEHEDFVGHKGKIFPGDLQWMTAGRGIVHAEMPASAEMAHGLQLWVNLPKKDKMVPPRYQELTDSNVPRAVADGVVVKVIAGESLGVKAKVHTYIPLFYLDFKMVPGKAVTQKIPAGYTGFVYVLSGSALFGADKTKGEPHTTMVMSDEGDGITIETTENDHTHFVIIAGEKINEPIVQHGPFVMNSKNEIYAAITDYQLGQNGFEAAADWHSEIAKRGM
ncbi:hypothetical protein SmJEL517_g03968 [Synchytrium microbalum]|uniref:Pirin N-terminal domain-containing protein n=1 Tax=Synchytrium microbalum TaxID=1806994 RepID=A0A507BZX6_9FUNG|nr:uncharacterized protein SmJEL517_g03968 [Synchytrium microbalum]TPX32992.1 hypothetical protein SmJEL517_g03968 [Synchytrium microbalum]